MEGQVASAEGSAGWSSSEMMDILRHHISLALRWGADMSACRMVCRTWRDALITPFAFLSPQSASENPELFLRVAATSRSFKLMNPDAVFIARFSSIVQRNPYVDAVEMAFGQENPIYPEISQAICDFLRLNIPTLTFFGATADLKLEPDVSRAIAQALKDTTSPLRTIDFGWCRLEDVGGSAVFSALRDSKSVRKLSLRSCRLALDSQDELIDFIHKNTSVRNLNLEYNWEDLVDSSRAKSLSDALETNTTLKILNMASNSGTYISPMFSAFKTNKTLRSLKLDNSYLPGDQIPFIFDCLGHNGGLRRLEIQFTQFDDAAQALDRFFRTNRTLDRFMFRMDGFDTIPYGTMFEGLCQNSSLTALDFPHVSSRFVEGLSDAIIQNSHRLTLPLQKLCMRYSDIGESVTKLSEALSHLPQLYKLDLSVSKVGPGASEALARLLERTTTLEEVSFFGCGIEDAGVIRICHALKNNRTLRVCGLGGDKNRATCVLDSLCDLISTNHNLEFLDLSGMPMPLEYRPLFEAVLLKNPTMSRCECSFSGDGSYDLCEKMQRRG
eukprot:TRINITY_DN1051_c0_g1_i1.p1 TRINITY_DN1051_c0_g1~~TRINITY_DN1051_c0_g1_i1.p1  ORF type:complete len:556 (+),score=46.66 TRINITY_DN1051_c0_g1_i1:133-1800(+)